MEDWVYVLLGLAVLLVTSALGLWATVGTFGWLDVRSAEDADDVRRNIDEYGPEVPGLKLGLLPPEERAAVLAAREAARQERELRRTDRHQQALRH